MTVCGIDVSHFQGHVDWRAVAASGVSFALCKATEGTGFLDPELTANLAGMRAAGVLPGVYHFMRGPVPGRVGGGAEQARTFARVVRPERAPLLCAVDVETRDVLPADLGAFAQEWRRLQPSRPLLCYSNAGLWCGGAAPPGLVLWHAGYVNGRYAQATGTVLGQWASVATAARVTPFGGWAGARLWQHTDHAAVPGVAAPCDGDVWTGTLDELAALAGDSPQAPTTTPLLEALMALDPAERDDLAQAFAEAFVDRLLAAHVGGGAVDATNVAGALYRMQSEAIRGGRQDKRRARILHDAAQADAAYAATIGDGPALPEDAPPSNG